MRRLDFIGAGSYRVAREWTAIRRRCRLKESLVNWRRPALVVCNTCSRRDVFGVWRGRGGFICGARRRTTCKLNGGAGLPAARKKGQPAKLARRPCGLGPARVFARKWVKWARPAQQRARQWRTNHSRRARPPPASLRGRNRGSRTQMRLRLRIGMPRRTRTPTPTRMPLPAPFRGRAGPLREMDRRRWKVSAGLASLKLAGQPAGRPSSCLIARADRAPDLAKSPARRTTKLARPPSLGLRGPEKRKLIILSDEQICGPAGRAFAPKASGSPLDLAAGAAAAAAGAAWPPRSCCGCSEKSIARIGPSSGIFRPAGQTILLNRAKQLSGA